MNKMKKLTKPLTLFLAVLTIVSCFSITASAASKSASLKTSDKIAYSGVITGKQCKYSGSNSSLSAGNVYFLAKNNHGELVLNPKGGNAYGCIASGTITSVA